MFASKAEEELWKKRDQSVILEPTCKLRWREKEALDFPEFTPMTRIGEFKSERMKTIKVLEQWWKDLNSANGEWREVETVKLS